MYFGETSVFKEDGSQDPKFKVQGNEFFRTLHYYKSKWIFAFNILAAVVGGILPSIMMVVFAGLFDNFTGGNLLTAFNDVLIKNLYLIIAMIVVMTSSFALRGYADTTFVKDMRNALFKSNIEQDLYYFDEVQTGVLISRLSEDVTFVLNSYVEKFMTAIQFLTQLLGSVVIAFIYCWRVALMSLAVVPICLFTYLFSEYLISKQWTKFRDSSTYLAGKAEEIVTNFRTVKSFDNELFEADAYSKGLNEIHKIVVKTAKIHGIKNSILYFISFGIIVPTIYYGSYLVLKKPELNVSAGDVVRLISVFGNIGMSAAMLMSVVDDIKRAGYSATKLLSILDSKPSINRKDGKEFNDGEVKGKIEFQNVSFKYRTREVYAVHNLSFTVNPGETVALVGESGCGKTTTLQLLQRLYEINDGKILIDNEDIKEYSQQSLREQMSIVPQTPVLFSMSITDNIKFGKPDCDDSAVVAAAKIGNSHDFIMELPKNYSTEIEQMTLSGGQKQRICISRAILMNTPILLLDEATAALDTESEQLVLQSLEQCKHEKTIIIVAHRLATVKNADRILVFRQGQIVEEGTHEDLLARNGIYSNLIHFQLQ